jgi:hypothetical protein
MSSPLLVREILRPQGRVDHDHTDKEGFLSKLGNFFHFEVKRSGKDAPGCSHTGSRQR